MRRRPLDGRRHSRPAYSEVLYDEKGPTCAGFLQRAIAYFVARGITQKLIKPHCPWQNGTVERLNRTLADGWAYRRHYASTTERNTALPGWLHFYNHHRIHSAIGDAPISRLNNLPGHHT